LLRVTRQDVRECGIMSIVDLKIVDVILHRRLIELCTPQQPFMEVFIAQGRYRYIVRIIVTGGGGECDPLRVPI
jgi:hypothetical protein